MAAALQTLTLAIVPCLANAANPKIVHDPHIYHVIIQPAVQVETLRPQYLYCPGWTG